MLPLLGDSFYLEKLTNGTIIEQANLVTLINDFQLTICCTESHRTLVTSHFIITLAK